eukprot:scaffold17_cov354-Pavlova_lutheri.AAC.5
MDGPSQAMQPSSTLLRVSKHKERGSAEGEDDRVTDVPSLASLRRCRVREMGGKRDGPHNPSHLELMVLTESSDKTP